jgi:hypothetical protein
MEGSSVKRETWRNYRTLGHNLSSLPYMDSNCQSLGQQAVTMYFTIKLSDTNTFYNYKLETDLIKLFSTSD